MLTNFEHAKLTKSSGTFSQTFKLKLMPKHTNLPNEIDGSYYEEKTDWTTIAVVTIGTIVTLLIIADVVFGAEAVTYWIAGLF